MSAGLRVTNDSKGFLIPHGATAKGSRATELRRALQQNFASVVEQQPQITKVFVEGDTVVLFGRERGRLRTTGELYDVEFVEKSRFGTIDLRQSASSTPT